MNRCASIFLDEAGTRFQPQGNPVLLLSAVFRKLQRGETEHYDRIKPAVRSEDDFFRNVARALGGLTAP